MGDKGIPPPDFNAGGSNSLPEDLEIELDEVSFQRYVEQTNQESQDEIEEQREQEEDEEAAKLKAAQKEELRYATKIEEQNKETELEDSESLAEEREAQSKEMTRSLLSQKDREKESIFNSRPKTSKKSTRREGRSKTLVKEKGLRSTKKTTSKNAQESKSKVTKHDNQKEHHKKTDETTQKDQQKKADKKHEDDDSLKIKHQVKDNAGQTNTHLHNINTSGVMSNQLSQKSSVTNTDDLERREALEALAAKLINEAKTLENGDVIETKIQFNLPGSQLDGGEVTLTAYKYRPLEVNLAFEKFDPQMTKMIRDRKKSLLELLEKNKLKVHQLDII